MADLKFMSTRKPFIGLTVTLIATCAACFIGAAAEAKGKGSTGGGDAIVEKPRPITLEMLTQEVENTLQRFSSDRRGFPISRFYWDLEADLFKEAQRAIVYHRMDTVPWWRQPELIEGYAKRQDPFRYNLVRKLFPINGEKTVVTVFYSTVFKVKTDGDCIDKDGKPKDATAYVEAPNVVCFSGKRLVKKMDTSNYKQALMALAIHEVSHGMRTTEEEAEWLQEYYRNEYAYKDTDSFQFESTLNYFEESANSLVTELQSGKSDAFSACMSVIELIKQYNQMLGSDIPLHETVHGYPLDLQNEFISLWAKTYNLRSACASPGSAQRAPIETAFGGKKEMELGRYITRLYREITANPMVGWMAPPPVVATDKIRLIDSGDMSGLGDATLEIHGRIKAVQARLYQLWFRPMK